MPRLFFTTTSPQADKAGRVDIYAGHGPQAEATARGQWADGKLFILVKKLPARER